MQHPDDNIILTLVTVLRPHSLQKYSAIHKESLEECQAFLKENETLDIVHPSHIRQKTGRIVGCIVHYSEEPNTALHPWMKEVDLVSIQGGVENAIPAADETS